METEVIWVALVAAVPISLYLLNRLYAMRAPDSPGGEAVTWDELVETFSDAQFWDHINAVKDELDE